MKAKKDVFHKKLGLTLIVSFFVVSINLSARADWTGSDNPTGPTGYPNGFVTTGCGYDAYTANVKRTVVDLTVPGAVGQYPLTFARILCSRNTIFTSWMPGSNWRHNYAWKMFLNRGLNGWEVDYPDGRVALFPLNSSRTKSFSLGYSDWLENIGGVYRLVMSDGGIVNFSATTGLATSIVDPFGLITTLQYDSSNQLTKVTEPGGRYLVFNYTTCSWNNVSVLSSVQGSDGNTVYYHYTQSPYPSQYPSQALAYCLLSSVNYSDGTTATYTYQPSNGSPQNTTFNPAPLIQTCNDTRATSAMRNITYQFRSDSTVFGELQAEKNGSDGTTVVSSYTLSSHAEVRGDGPGQSFAYGVTVGGTSLGYLMASQTDYAGKVTHYGYDSNAYLQSVQDALNNITTFTNESVTGKPTRITYPDGTYRDFTYTNPTYPYYLNTASDELGRVTSYIRFSNNTLGQVWHPDGSKEYFAYNQFNQMTIHQYPANDLNGTALREFWNYDAQGRLIKYWPKTRQNPTTDSDPHLTFAYYPAGHPWAERVSDMTDANGNTSHFEYDQALDVNGQISSYSWSPCHGRGLLTKIINPDGSFKTFGYNKFGDKLWEENELRQRISYSYDDYGRLLTVTDANNRVASNDYNHTGNPYSHTKSLPRSTTTPTGKRTAYLYDVNWRLFWLVDGDWSSDISWKEYDYDAVGNVVKMRQQIGGDNNAGTATWRDTIITYDSRNRNLTQTDPLGNITKWTYDAVGNVRFITNPDNSQMETRFDTMDRPTDSFDELRHQTTMTYWPDGNPRLIYNARAENAALGPYISFDYDAQSREFMRTSQDGSIEVNTFDKNGNVLTHTNRAGEVMTFTYDNRDRETGHSFSNPNTPNVTITYDSVGRVTGLSNSNSTLTYAYDNVGLLTGEVQAVAGVASRSLVYTNDFDGRRTRIQTNSYDGTYFFNNRDQLTQINFNGITSVVSCTYNVDQTRSNKTLYNATGAALTYDGAGRATALNNYRVSDNSVIQLLNYGYDARDRLKWRQRNQGLGDAFAYQLDGQLTQNLRDVQNPNTIPINPAQTLQYTYDVVGNRTGSSINGATTSYASNALNEYTMVGGTSPTYDAKGGLATYNGWTYTYNVLGQLIQASIGSTTATLAYDPLGRLCKRTINGQTETAVFDGGNVISRYQSNGTLIESNLWVPDSDELLAQWNSVKGYVFYHLDLQGSVIAATDSNRIVLEQYKYNAFGGAEIYDASWNSRATTAIGNRYLFTGQEYVASLGLYYYKNRFYHATLGRFIQPDPFGLKGGDGNFYRYCGNDGVNYLDASGNFTVSNPGFYGVIPVVGSAWSAAYAIQEGNTWEAGFDIGITVLDIATVGEMGSVLRFTKVGGSQVWKSGIRPYLGKVGFAQKGQPVHHWLISQAMGKKLGIPNWIVHNPLNLLPMESQKVHNLVEGKKVAKQAYSITDRFLEGTPTWAKEALGSTIAHLSESTAHLGANGGGPLGGGTAGGIFGSVGSPSNPFGGLGGYSNANPFSSSGTENNMIVGRPGDVFYSNGPTEWRFSTPSGGRFLTD